MPDVDLTATARHRIGKRALDLVLGSVLALLVTPIIVVLALVLALQARGWPFFVHHRVGTRGRLVSIPKLRTLSRNTPRYVDKTKVGLEPVSGFATWLRHRHLDELPQLFLVPLGRLSLVGPRPRMLAEVEGTNQPVYDHVRVLVRQGCTGLWQVGAHQSLTVSANPEYDLFYMHHGSTALDLWILWRTAAQAIFGVHGVELDNVPQWALGRGFVQVPEVESLHMHPWLQPGIEPVSLA